MQYYYGVWSRGCFCSNVHSNPSVAIVYSMPPPLHVTCSYNMPAVRLFTWSALLWLEFSALSGAFRLHVRTYCWCFIKVKDVLNNIAVFSHGFGVHLIPLKNMKITRVFVSVRLETTNRYTFNRSFAANSCLSRMRIVRWACSPITGSFSADVIWKPTNRHQEHRLARMVQRFLYLHFYSKFCQRQDFYWERSEKPLVYHNFGHLCIYIFIYFNVLSYLAISFLIPPLWKVIILSFRCWNSSCIDPTNSTKLLKNRNILNTFNNYDQVNIFAQSFNTLVRHNKWPGACRKGFSDTCWLGLRW